MATVDGAAFATPREPQRDTALALLLAGLSIAAWLALWSWSASPYARYAAHDGWLDATAFAALCRALPGGTLVVPAVLYALAWVLMIAAMMLPTTYPLLGIFRAITRGRPDGTKLVALVVGGFFAAWFAFGLVAHLADSALAWAGAQSPWLALHGWI